MVSTAKRVLSFEQIDAQTAVELPDRDMMALVTIVITEVIDDVVIGPTNVQVPIGVAANVCGVQANLLAQGTLTGPINCTAATTQDLPAKFR